MNCPFCDSTIKQSVFNENKYFYAIYNIAPIFPGHSLIIPKEHISRFHSLTEKHMCNIMLFTGEVMRQIENVFHPEGFDFTIQDGFWAGQTIDHFHAHLIPRYKNDLPDPGDWYPKFEKNQKKIIDTVSRPRLSFDEISIVVEKLKKC